MALVKHDTQCNNSRSLLWQEPGWHTDQHHGKYEVSWYYKKAALADEHETNRNNSTQMRKDYCSVLTRQEGAIEMQPNLYDLE